MDYEDNDFQSQSFQLAVEENIVFSPSPHSYSLPKFDLDDNLQVHLKFDSLVEPEVLLGIQTQEENQWIKDYSRESSGLEFSSGATEACSISRCNNIWSEATSSESVDLLLKSVRQEEMLVEQAIIEESDNCDRLASTENQMKPSVDQDSFAVSKTETAPSVVSVSKLNELGEQLSNLGKDVTDYLPQDDSSSQTAEGAYLVKNDNSKLTGLKVDVHATNKSEGDESHIDSFHECIRVTSCTASLQNSASFGELYSVAPHGSECLEKDEAEIARVKVFSSSPTHGHQADTNVKNLGMCSFIQKVGSSAQVTELSTDAMLSRNTAQIAEYEETVPTKSADTIDQLIVDLPKITPCMADRENICIAPSAAISIGTIEDHSIQTTSKSDQTTHGYSSVGTVAEQESLSDDVDHRLDNMISMNETEMIPVKEKNSEVQFNEDINDNIGDSFDVLTDTVNGELNSDAPQRDECLEKINAEISRVKVFSNSQTHDGNLADAGDNNLANMPSSVQKVDFMPRVTEFSSDVTLSRSTSQIGECEHIISSKSADTTDQFIVDFSKASSSVADGENICVAPAAISTGTVGDHLVEISSKSDQATHGYVNVGTIAEQEDLLEDVCHQFDDGISISDTEKLSFEGQRNEVNSDSFNLVVKRCSSAHLSNESQMSSDRQEMGKDVELHSYVDCSRQTSAQMLTNTESIVDYFNCSDASTHEKETRKFSVDSELSGVVPEVVILGADKIVDDVDGLDCPDASRPGRVLTNSELGGVASEVINMASEKVLDSVHSVLLRSNIANHESIHDKKGLDAPSDVHIPPSSKPEETGTIVSVLDATESYKVSYKRITSPESEHCKISYKSIEMSAGIVGRSSSSMVTPSKMSQNEPASDVAKTDFQSGGSTGLGKGSVIDAAALKENECVEICEKYKMLVPKEAKVMRPCHEENSEHSLPPASEEASNHTESNDLENNRAPEINNGVGTDLPSAKGLHPNHEETPKHSLPSSLLEASYDIVVEDVENHEASETINDLKTAFAVRKVVSGNELEGISGIAVISEGDAEGHVVEVKSNSHHSNEPNHASTGVSCIETSLGSGDNIDAVSVKQEVSKVDEANCGSSSIISCNEASQSDKGSRQRSTGSLDHSDSDTLEKGANRDTGGAVDPEENATADNDGSFSFKVQCSSTLASGLDPVVSDDIADANLQISGETNAFKSTESDHKSEPINQSTTNGETVGEVKPLSNEQYGGKEHQEGVGRLDQNVAVSSNREQLAVDVLTDQDPKQNITAEVDRNVVLEKNQIADPSEKEAGSKSKAVHSIQTNEFFQSVGSSPPTSFTCLTDSKVVHDIPHDFHPITTDVTIASQSVGSSADGDTKSSSGKAYKEYDNEQDISKKFSSVKHTEVLRTNSLRTSPISPVSVAKVVQAGDVQAVELMQCGTVESSDVATAQTSSLSDLNSLKSSKTLFQQPFTDFQQVQLRAQIFIYGSILQGTAPDEACMQAAFGGSDGERREWEKVWRVAIERHHNQKSPLSNAKISFSNPKTPVPLNIGARVAEATRQTVHRESVCTPGLAESIKSPPVVFSPNMPFSSPIWSPPVACRDGQLSSSMPMGPLVDSSKKFLPLQTPQSPHMRHYVGNTSPWLTQVPSTRTWGVNQSAAVDASGHYTSLPICETVRVTSVRESSAPHCSGKQHTPNSAIRTGSPNSTVHKSLVLDAKRTTGSPARQASAESKPRKKRRNMASEESGKLSFVPSQTEAVSVSQPLASFATTTIISRLNDASISAISGNSLVSSPMNTPQFPRLVATTATPSTSVVSGGFISGCSPVSSVMNAAQLTSSVATTAVSSSLNVASVSLTSGNSLVSSAQDKIFGLKETDMMVSFSEKTCSGIKQAKRHAEEAAADAASAVRHCQSIWNQLSIQKNSGVVLEIQAKLGSSAVSVAAASSVAKAAAAIAKVAYDAALEAQLMADEALVACKSGNSSPENSLCDDAKNLGRVSPSSILKGKNITNNADSVLVSARETAKKRVEAASAAAKRAENLDSLLKAAEMTAEAVSQAGTIIAMGEPLPFTLPELVDAGPEGYWKVYRKSSEQLGKLNNVLPEEINEDGVGYVKEVNEILPNKNDTRETVESSKGSAENRMLPNGLISGSVSCGKESESQKGCSDNELSKTIGVTPETQVASENTPISMQNEETQGHQLVSTSNQKKYEDGSLVEVRSNVEGLGTVWLSAKVLSSEDGKALVAYTEHACREGTSQATEWVLLDDKEDNAPRIRFPHPLSVVKYDGTKKRNREARGDYTWSVGDRVDALTSNGWREGVITDKSKEDETKLTVNFPAQQETSVVRVWDLRPSLFWEDGKWIEWHRPGGIGCLSHERKPPKKSKLEDEVKRKDKITKIPSITESKIPETQKPLVLSTKEKVFNAGRSSTKDVTGKKPTGLQKEISIMNLNAPKPGKKRKFMDMSKVCKLPIFKSEKSEALGSVSSRDVASDSICSKRKASSDVAATLPNKGKALHLAEKLVKNNEKGAALVNSTPSSVEPRRSNRKIQPTSRLLEGIQSSLTLSKIPAASHDKSTKAQQKTSRGRIK